MKPQLGTDGDRALARAGGRPARAAARMPAGPVPAQIPALAARRTLKKILGLLA
jgi:hypothetical protein